ncbi:MAG TPA: response regulator transcription factor [Flavisolibacter sp.]|nr:response regulator transcription factor [Flavisolibacter sp.]
MSAIRIVLADDHEIFRNGFNLLLKNQQEIQLVGEAANGKQLICLVEEVMPDVVITDIQMPEMNGIEACRIIKKQFPDVAVIALSTFNDDHYILDMLEAGAIGYLLKNTNRQELHAAVHSVFEGTPYYSKDTSKKMARLIAESKLLPGRRKEPVTFSIREVEVMKLICQQLTNKEIAARLKLSVRTVESHRERIQEKTNSRNIAGIVIYALKHNLFQL